MPFELEALVGHLYIAGGRAIKTTPPGALVEVAPRKAARGRELDTFFVLVLPSGTIAPNTFYEQMAIMAAERYFTSGGSVTSAMREVFNTLNTNLYEHNQDGHRHYEASMICAVLRGTELYLARVGAGAAILRYNGQNHTLPEDFTNEESFFQRPLGIQPVPNVQVKRFNVDSGSRLLLVDASILELTPEQSTQSIVAENLEAVLDDYKQYIRLQTQLMAIEFVPADEPAPVPAATGTSSAAIAAELAAVRSRSQSQPAAEAAPAAMPATPRRRLAWRVRKAAGNVVQQTGQSISNLGSLGGKLLSRRDQPQQRRFSTSALTSIVIGFPLVIVFIVVLSWAGGVGETAFETCVSDALQAGSLARSINSSQPQSVLVAWQGTLTIVDRCQELRPNDAIMNDLKREGQNVIDSLNYISRRTTSLVASFPDASLTSMVLQGLDLYALDRSNSLVYRIQIAPDGVSATSSQLMVNMRRGASVSGLQVGEIIDIAFDEQANSLVALDRQGVLVRCLPNFTLQCDAQRVPGYETWVNPVAITTWRGALYVLDPGARQLWRYTAAGGNYATSPTEYFVGANRPPLQEAIEFGITRTGTGVVYVLYSNGIMTSHLGGQAQPFAFTGFPPGQEIDSSTVQGMYMNDGAILQAFYIVSRPQRTIYSTTLAGTYQNAYQIFADEQFELLNDVAVDSTQQIIYASSGNSVFAIRMNESAN